MAAGPNGTSSPCSSSFVARRMSSTAAKFAASNSVIPVISRPSRPE